MLFAYRREADRLARMPPGADLTEAMWIDLYRPQPEEAEAIAGLGVGVPSLAEMEEIEISNRLYSENGVDYLTVVLPGQTPDKEHVAGPVAFILSKGRLITVRHHAPRPFETFPDRADRASTGCGTAERTFLGLAEEIVARQADLLEGAGRVLDDVAREVYSGDDTAASDRLRGQLREVGRQGELLGRIRLGLLTMERALSFFTVIQASRKPDAVPKAAVKAMVRDINALEVHADFLGSRVALIADATLGMINLEQAQTVKAVSVVSVIFLPPTVIASAYGMNFALMPELQWRWGYPMAIGLMIASAALTWLFFRWKRML